MKKLIILLLLIAPIFVFAQRGQAQQNTNEFHNRDFWKTKPDVATIKQKIKEGNDAVKPNQAAFDALYQVTVLINRLMMVEVI